MTRARAHSLEGPLLQPFDSGTYVPLLSGLIAGVTGGIWRPSRWMRVRSVVTVDFSLRMTDSSGPRLVVYNMSLPPGLSVDIVGSAAALTGTLVNQVDGGGFADAGGAVIGISTIDTAGLLYTTQGTGAELVLGRFSYVLPPTA